MESCTLGRNNPRHHYVLGVTQLKSSFAENGLGLLVDTKLNMNQQCALATKKATVFLTAKYRQQVRKGDPSALLSTGEVAAGALCPVLGLPVQERHGHNEKSPMERHKDVEGTGASLLREKAEESWD